MSGIYSKESAAYARRLERKPKMITISIRCWDTQAELLEQAAAHTGVAWQDAMLLPALERSAKTLGFSLPEFPPIKRAPVKGTTPIERAAKVAGLSVKELMTQAADEFAEKILATADSATGSAPRKVGGNSRR